jgi:DNA-binding CsgD family transcriptional regulator
VATHSYYRPGTRRHQSGPASQGQQDRGVEEELVKLVVRGLSTTRISQMLFISEHTVHNHLRSVFEKVGVRSRGELVKRLFFDNLYPTLFR